MKVSMESIQMKMVVIGDSSVGKTNIIHRYCDNRFDGNTIPTIAIDFINREVLLYGRLIKVQFWDTAGQEKYRSISKNYYKMSNIIVVVFDVTNQKSFENLGGWLEDVKTFGADNTHVYIVGNKIDRIEERVISNEEAKEFCNQRKLPYFEVSAALDNKGLIHETIDEIIKLQLTDIDKQKLSGLVTGQPIREVHHHRRGWCC